jgi:hypothetical protein
MAHFAELNADNIVQRIVVVANAVLDKDGVETESQGVTHLQSLYGADTQWKQCSYNGTTRFRFPSPGMFYDASKDGFYTPQPHDNWVWDDTLKCYVPPVAYPTDGNAYHWDQEGNQWTLAD